MHLTLFDLDNTLLAGDSDYLWGRFLIDQGLVDAAHYARENARFHAQYAAGNLDIHAYQRLVLTPLIDYPPPRMKALRQRYVSAWIAPIVARHAPALIAHHRKRGDAVVIITATNRFVTEPIAELLGVEHLIATEPEVVDGAYTGKIAGTPCYQNGKITRADEWIEAQPEPFTQTVCYSDSHNDLPLLRWADQAVAVDPDDTLATEARTADWPIISLRGETPPKIR